MREAAAEQTSQNVPIVQGSPTCAGPDINSVEIEPTRVCEWSNALFNNWHVSERNDHVNNLKNSTSTNRNRTF